MRYNMTLIEAVSVRLKAILAERGLTNYKIEKMGGVPRSTVGKVVSTKFKTIELNTLYQITSTLGISLKEFFDDPIFDEVSD
ncbi:MAG: helix-turn-helix transcriptional regulator [Clostridia bacterium]|nr:helix-turn-helix transcriptional regulator [Clostridia bacterium]